MNKNKILRNGSGYVDPTAYQAIIKVDGENAFKEYKMDKFIEELGELAEKHGVIFVDNVRVRFKKERKIYEKIVEKR